VNGSSGKLVRLLADGKLHSGERLAAALGITRAAVWKAVAELRSRGIAVTSRDRRGYELERPVELLDLDGLHEAARAAGVALPRDTELHFEIASTNEYLHASEPPAPGAPRLVFAELQTAGRGRRGRAWLAPFGSGLTFSIGWTFAEMPPDLPALGLAMGVCVVRALRQLGATEAQIKWPNDIVHAHCKLGGLLLQTRSETGGPAYVVAGLGLNLRLPAIVRDEIARTPNAAPVADLDGACSGAMPARHAVAARVASAMIAGLERFALDGFASFARDWDRFDSLRDAAVTVLRHDGPLDGIARGTDTEGALRVELPGGSIERIHAGDVSLRRGGSAR
jgi:BirA family biotin operon repressor/biotin-[acetyl-CoA-carboxylase] ligase